MTLTRKEDESQMSVLERVRSNELLALSVYRRRKKGPRAVCWRNVDRRVKKRASEREREGEREREKDDHQETDFFVVLLLCPMIWRTGCFLANGLASLFFSSLRCFFLLSMLSLLLRSCSKSLETRPFFLSSSSQMRVRSLFSSECFFLFPFIPPL